MTYSFTVEGRLPSLNDYIRACRSGYHAGNRMKRECERIIFASAVSGEIPTIYRPVFIRYRFYEGGKRRDKDNIAGIAHKFVQDALVKAGILRGDGWDYVTGFEDRFAVDHKRPRIEIELEEE